MIKRESAFLSENKKMPYVIENLKKDQRLINEFGEIKEIKDKKNKRNGCSDLFVVAENKSDYLEIKISGKGTNKNTTISAMKKEGIIEEENTKETKKLFRKKRENHIKENKNYNSIKKYNDYHLHKNKELYPTLKNDLHLLWKSFIQENPLVVIFQNNWQENFYDFFFLKRPYYYFCENDKLYKLKSKEEVIKKLNSLKIINKNESIFFLDEKKQTIFQFYTYWGNGQGIKTFRTLFFIKKEDVFYNEII